MGLSQVNPLSLDTNKLSEESRAVKMKGSLLWNSICLILDLLRIWNVCPQSLVIIFSDQKSMKIIVSLSIGFYLRFIILIFWAE